ncbi:OTU protein [Coniothyrium glycines]
MADEAPELESLEALAARHRKEQRDLASQTTQKKKQASKKTRKAVNEECERLETALRQKHAHERQSLNGEDPAQQELAGQDAPSSGDDESMQSGIGTLSLDGESSHGSRASSVSDAAEAAPGGRQKKPNRAKERLARRAAEQAALVAEAEREAANAPDPRELERERMAAQLARHRLVLQEIRADGHCLYAAVSDQFESRALGLQPAIPITAATAAAGVQGYQKVRCAAADWIQAHGDDFAGFMEDPLPEHVRKVRETGEWGGHLELLALARTYGVRICVLHSDGRVDKIQPEEGKDLEEIWLGYYKHSHGLGEHYNSLRKAG